MNITHERSGLARCRTLLTLLCLSCAVLVTAPGGSAWADITNGAHLTNNGISITNVRNYGTIDNNGLWTGNIITNTGTINNNAGATWTGNATNNAGGTITNAGTWTGTITNAGTFSQTGGALSGGLTNSGTVNASGGAINGAIANSSNFNVTGTVTSDNTFTNANGATLAITGSGTYTVAGKVTNNGTVSIANGGRLTATAGGLDNNGTVTVAAGGRLDDDLNNTGTFTNNGLVNAEVASNTGTITNSAGATWTGNATNNAGGTITNAGTWTGTITNAGTFNQTGGALSGGLTNSGTVNASGGAINGAIANNSTFNVTGTVTSDNTFTNANGATLAISQGGNYTVAGGVRNAGLLNVNGVLAAPLTTIDAVGRLTGTGTIRGDVVNNGTIGPGNSIGTLTVNGNVTFNRGSTYEVETNAAGSSDRIDASGKAVINGGTVSVLAGTGEYSMLTTYTIVSTKGGRTGAFDRVTTNLAFLTPTLGYDSNNVYLRLLRNDRRFDDVGKTPNQRATGRGAESLGIDNPLYRKVVNLTAPQASGAFDQLSGEAHASLRGALIEDSRFLREAASDRLRAAFDDAAAPDMPGQAYGADGQAVFWTRGFGTWADAAGNGNAAGLKHSMSGFLTGMDAPVFDDWRFGLMAGYSQTSFKVKDRASEATSNNYHVGLYGGTHWGDLALRTGAAWSLHDLDASRSVAFSGFSDRLKSDALAGTAQVFGELGYGLRFEDVALEPFANLAYVNLDSGGFRERGGAAALAASGGTMDTTFTTLGLRGTTSFTVWDMNLTVKGMAGWRHAFGDVTPLVKERFPGGAPFMVAGVPVTRDAAAVEAGIELPLGSTDGSLGISYNGQFGPGLTDQSVRASLNMRF